jgi:hypothetical protein
MLLREIRFSGYLLYALGEIVLVVIGILLALQINNWNEARHVEAVNRVMLRQLQDENKSNLKELLGYKARQDTILPTITHFLEYLRTGMEPLDTLRLRKNIAHLLNSTSYSFSENYLMSYINANQSEQSALSSQLVELHSTQEDLNYISVKNLENRLDNFFGYLENTVDFYDLTIEDFGIFSTLQFRNRVAMILALESESNRQYFRTLKQQQVVDSLLTAYLSED